MSRDVFMAKLKAIYVQSGSDISRKGRDGVYPVLLGTLVLPDQVSNNIIFLNTPFSAMIQF